MIAAPADAVAKEDVSLSELIPEDEWGEYCPVMADAAKQGLAFALGGGLALSTYSGRWRDTKDVDLFIEEAERWRWIELIGSHGFGDYYDQAPYDRTWIYRGFRDDVILDLIWTMPNHRMKVDRTWLTRGRQVTIHGMRVRLLPPEEYLWSKLYVLQRDRCDWPDILNVLRGYSCRLNWRRLLDRLGEDRPLMAGVVSVFGWLCPEQARELPGWLWAELGVARPEPSCSETEERTFLLDTREWFGPTMGKDRLCS